MENISDSSGKFLEFWCNFHEISLEIPKGRLQRILPRWKKQNFHNGRKIEEKERMRGKGEKEKKKEEGKEKRIRKIKG